jgi:hypothetical protein
MQAGNLEGPTEFGKLLHNVRLLSMRFNPHFKAAWKTAGDKLNTESGTKNASVDFEVANRVRVPPRANPIADATLRDQFRAGGTVDVFARHALGSGVGWLRVGYGLRIDVVPKKEGVTPKVMLYAYSAGHNVAYRDCGWRKVSWEAVTTRAEGSMDMLEVHTRAALRELLEGLREEGKVLSKKQRTAVAQLLKSLA